MCIYHSVKLAGQQGSVNCNKSKCIRAHLRRTPIMSYMIKKVKKSVPSVLL